MSQTCYATRRARKRVRKNQSSEGPRQTGRFWYYATFIVFFAVIVFAYHIKK